MFLAELRLQPKLDQPADGLRAGRQIAAEHKLPTINVDAA